MILFSPEGKFRPDSSYNTPLISPVQPAPAYRLANPFHGQTHGSSPFSCIRSRRRMRSSPMRQEGRRVNRPWFSRGPWRRHSPGDRRSLRLIRWEPTPATTFRRSHEEDFQQGSRRNPSRVRNSAPILGTGKGPLFRQARQRNIVWKGGLIPSFSATWYT